MKVIDFHVHIFPPEVIRNKEKFFQRDRWFEVLYSSPRAKMITAEELIQVMDEDGVDAAVAFSFAWSDMGLCRCCNDYVLDAMRRYPGRIYGFAAVQPRAGNEAVREIERCIESGMKGIGELMPNGQGYALDDEDIMTPVVAAAVAYDVPLMVHTSEPVGHNYRGKGTISPGIVYNFIQNHPELTLVCSHWGGGLPFYELMPKVREKLARVYYDTAATPFLYDIQIFPIVGEILRYKILFGTDFPLVRPGPFIEQIKNSGLSQRGLERILGENAARLLKINSADKNQG